MIVQIIYSKNKKINKRLLRIAKELRNKGFEVLFGKGERGEIRVDGMKVWDETKRSDEILDSIYEALIEEESWNFYLPSSS
ncbi:MAG: hypothetical protein OWQ54_01810 [Sulfolobaceae archaeon]|nr:hypothetical protein [Sulfolobaceae archaeon]